MSGWRDARQRAIFRLGAPTHPPFAPALVSSTA